MKGIILAGGSGSRLFPLTMVTSKQLLPIYDKPMIYYPLSILMLAGVKEILIISTPEDTPRFKSLLGDGNRFGINLSYKIQPSPDGLAQAFLIGEEFIGNDTACMILGDNIFYGNGIKNTLSQAVENSAKGKATVFGYYVDDPERFGVVEFDKKGKAVSIEEKPTEPKSNYAVTGLYFYDKRVVEFAKKGKAVSIEEKPTEPKSNYAVTGLYFYDKRVVEFAKQVKPSKRGELEITDLNRLYLEDGSLDVVTFGRGLTWLDTGTHESLAEATAFVKMIEDHQGLKISCPEEIAYHNGWISKEQLREQAELFKKSQYGKFLFDVLEGRVKY
jgi:glucose-1-phosphate thymidylyltransferase